MLHALFIPWGVNNAQLLADSEPIRLCETPRSLSEYILMFLNTMYSLIISLQWSWQFCSSNNHITSQNNVIIASYCQENNNYYLKLTLWSFIFTVCLKWRLHFEFILASSPLPAGASPVQLTSSHTDVATWQGPPDIEVETVTWDLPIKILPTNPLNASSISTTRTSNAIVF